MADQATLVIFEKPYPIPTDYRPLDAVLIYELTGMEFVEYLEALDDDNKDIRAIPGLLGIALWRANPDWSRGQVMKSVLRVGSGDWRLEGGDTLEADAIPPSEAAGAAEDTLDTSPPSSSGEPVAA